MYSAAPYPSGAATNWNGGPGQQSSAAVAPSTPAGNSSISQLVQQLQAGTINKQQLYSSLTNMYKGGTPIAAPHSLLGSPSTANSSFSTSFSLNNSTAPPTPQLPFPAATPQPQQQQQQVPAAAAAPIYSSAQAQAAQQHIQSFLSKHNLNQSNAPNASHLSNSLNNSSLNISDSLNLSLAQSQSTQSAYGQPAQPGPNASLNFSSAPHSFAQHHHQQPQQPNQSGQYSQVNQTAGGPPAFFSPAQNQHYPGGYGSPGSNLSGLSSFQGGAGDLTLLRDSGMDDSMARGGQGQGQNQQSFHHQPRSQQGFHSSEYHSGNSGDEAEEYSPEAHSHGFRAGQGQQQRRQQQQPYRRGTARQSVRERMAQVYTEEKNKDLTFKPAIQPLPKGLYGKSSSAAASSGADGEDATGTAAAPFLGRVMHWNENKRARERQRAVEVEKAALKECSFKPKLSPESVAIVEAPGASQRRLFSARSTARAKILELEVRRKEEEAFRAECTFAPTLNRKSLSMAGSVAVRRPLTAGPSSPSRDAQDAPPLGLSSSSKELAECTFAPKINPLKPGMNAAQMYLEQDPFERLASAKPKRGEELEEDGYNSDGAGARRHGRSRSQGSSSARRASSQDPSGSKHNRGVSSESQDASFTEFLARLKYKEFQRVERLNSLRAEEQKQYQYGRPMLSKNSAKIIARSMESGRYQSPSKHAVTFASAKAADQAHEHALVQHVGSPTQAQQREAQAKAKQMDPECTFTPTINPYSASLSRRSFHEMSQLELIRRSHNLEMAASERLAQEMQEASFTPHLLTNNSLVAKKLGQVDSRLKVVSEPDLYLERLEFQRRLREAEQERQKRVREEKEMESCTFTPAVHESPAFVKRIARSMEATRGQEMAAASRKKVGKPDWK